MEYELSPAMGGWQAANRAQDLRAQFLPGGVDLVRRTSPQPAWRLFLSLHASGPAGSTRPAGSAPPQASGRTVRYERPGVVETWENTEGGLRLRVEVDSSAAGPATVEYGLATGLEAQASTDGGEISFYEAGARVMRLRLTGAHDGRGGPLPARMAPGPGGLTLSQEGDPAASSVTFELMLTGPGGTPLGPGLSRTPDWTMDGDQDTGRLGWSVSSAGDVDGDGYSDLLIAASEYDDGQTDEGKVYLYMGSPSGPSMTPAWTAESNQAFAYFGSSVATAGDVNGDGYDDVIIGAQEYSNVQSREGRAYLYLGSASGLSTTPVWTGESNQDNALYGDVVSTAGDVNGDGYDDVLVGAYRYQNGEFHEGRVYVYLGNSSGLDTSPAWIGESNQINAEFGQAAQAAGDVNGDGYADIIVGAVQYGNGQTNEGRAYVFFGSASGLSATPDWIYESNQASAFLGFSVGTAGDVNGDGYADVIVGADQYDNGQSNEGRAYLFFGSPSGPSLAPDWFVESNQANALMGKQVTTAGDVNGDGYGDIVVGVRQYTNGETNEGRLYVYLGSATGPSTTPYWMAESDQAGARYGAAAITAGDVNGDGFGDLVVGADLYDTTQTDGGRVYLYLGAADQPAGTAGWTAAGGQPGAELGVSVGTALDVNGDGYSDLLVGADRYDNGEVDEGRAFLYLGSATGPAITPDWTAEIDQAGARFGASVAGAGDVDGDGYDDIIIGAPDLGNGEAGEGAAFVYLGSPAGPSSTPVWMAEGNQAGAHFGASVSGAGDVDGDGRAEIVVGAPGYTDGETGEGAAILYRGSASGPGVAPAWIAEGNQAQAGFGSSVATAGDVNRDGFSDVIVGAPKESDGTADEGAAHVYLGSPAGLATSPVWTATSGHEGSRFGSAVAGAGDVDGDGYSDVVVGAPNFTGSYLNEGAVFLFLGSASGPEQTAVWDVQGGQAGAYLGSSVASAGDVNGDGYSDLIAGAPGFDGSLADQGRVILYLGSSTAGSLLYDWEARGATAGAMAGASVSSAGDVGGDGFSDLIVGAPGGGAGGEGIAPLYAGNRAFGLARAPQQLLFAGTSPIALLGVSDSETGLRLAADGRSPFGRSRVHLEWEIKPSDTAFDGIGLSNGATSDTGSPGPSGSVIPLEEAVTGLDASTPLHWRLRVATRSPFFPHGPWLSPPGNAPSETDVRTAGCIDMDGDGFGAVGGPGCPGGSVSDCDDASPDVYPGAPQVCDGVNNDCSAPGWPALTGTNEADADGDTFTTCSGDCDDSAAAIYPGAPQVCDGVNNDCSAPGWPALTGTNEADADGDTFTTCSGDCDDSAAAIYPGAPQVCDGVNNDCSAPGWPALIGTNEADADGDTFTTCSGDCDDSAAAIYPGAPQVCDGVNNDCSAPGWPALTGTNEADADGDTFAHAAVTVTTVPRRSIRARPRSVTASTTTARLQAGRR